MTDFDGKSVIVTGGAGGMGRATVLAFAREGAAVVFADVDDERGEETAELARKESDNVVYQRTDVSSAADVEALVRTAVERHGGLHCAVNAAAIEGEDAGVAEADDANFDRIIAVNLRSIYLCLKHEIKAMLPAGSGAIVNIALDQRRQAAVQDARVRGQQARRDRPHPQRGLRLRGAGHPRERDLPRPDRHPDAAQGLGAPWSQPRRGSGRR